MSQVFDRFTDTAGNYHWSDVETGHHIISRDPVGVIETWKSWSQTYNNLVEKITMDALISKNAVLKLCHYDDHDHPVIDYDDVLRIPSVDAVEVVRCKDCVYGYRYFDVRNGETDSWVECRNPDGMNRDVSPDGYCSACIRKKEDE